MQNKIKLFIIILLFTTGLYAQNSQFVTSISSVAMNMDYREYDDGGRLIDSEKSDYGELGGAEMSLGYVYSKDATSYTQVNANFMFLAGSSAYEGSALGSSDAYGTITSTTQNIFMDMDIAYKQGYTFLEALELSYGVGFGYRFWERSLSASQIEQYTWFSLRPMVGANYMLNNKLNIGLSLEYQYGINPTMHISTFNYDFTLGRADIIEVSLPVSYTYNETISLFIEATYQQQTIDKSNTITRTINGVIKKIWEPDSQANNQYLKAGVIFKF